MSSAVAGELVISDGDSFKVNGERFRLWGIDAPELDQKCSTQTVSSYSCGQAAKAALYAILKENKFTCKKRSTDRYRRSVVTCMNGDNLDIGRILVQSGWAFDYKTYSKGYYKEFENYAAQNKMGLWKGKFQRPDIWRNEKRKRF